MSGARHALTGQHDILETVLGDTMRAARGADWAAYRANLRALGGAFAEHAAYQEEALFPALQASGLVPEALDAVRSEFERFRMHLEALGAAAPEHDPEGCIGELELLAASQRACHAGEAALCRAHAERVPVPPPFKLAGPATLDLRGLQPPEPIVRIFDALERAPRTPVRAILPHEPFPLYALLRERGFIWSGASRADGGYELTISKG